MLHSAINKAWVTFVVLAIISISLVSSIKCEVFAHNSGIESFVTSLYRDCLGREPDSIGFNDWCSRLSNGDLTGKECAYGFFYSPEFASKSCNISDGEKVDIFYRVFLNRVSDDDGRKYWLTRIADTDNDLSILFSGFADSVEFAQKCDQYGINAGSITGVTITSHSDEDLNYLNHGFEIHYLDLGYGNLQKVYVRWYDCGDCATQINDYRISNGISEVNYITNINDERVVYARARAIETAYCFSHRRPASYNTNRVEEGNPVCPSSGGGEDLYGAVVSGGFYGSAFEGWRTSPGHNANLLGDGVMGNTITIVSCEIVMPEGSSLDELHPGTGSSTVLLFWQ